MRLNFDSNKPVSFYELDVALDEFTNYGRGKTCTYITMPDDNIIEYKRILKALGSFGEDDWSIGEFGGTIAFCKIPIYTTGLECVSYE